MLLGTGGDFKLYVCSCYMCRAEAVTSPKKSGRHALGQQRCLPTRRMGRPPLDPCVVPSPKYVSTSLSLLYMACVIYRRPLWSEYVRAGVLFAQRPFARAFRADLGLPWFVSPPGRTGCRLPLLNLRHASVYIMWSLSCPGESLPVAVAGSWLAGDMPCGFQRGFWGKL